MPSLTLETDPQVVTLLETLIAEVRGLRADLARDRRPRRALSRADVDRLSRLLPAIAGAVGQRAVHRRGSFSSSPRCASWRPAWPRRRSGNCCSARVASRSHGYVVESDATELHRRVWRLEATV